MRNARREAPRSTSDHRPRVRSPLASEDGVSKRQRQRGLGCSVLAVTYCHQRRGHYDPVCDFAFDAPSLAPLVYPGSLSLRWAAKPSSVSLSRIRPRCLFGVASTTFGPRPFPPCVTGPGRISGYLDSFACARVPFIRRLCDPGNRAVTLAREGRGPSDAQTSHSAPGLTVAWATRLPPSSDYTPFHGDVSRGGGRHLSHQGPEF